MIYHKQTIGQVRPFVETIVVVKIAGTKTIWKTLNLKWDGEFKLRNVPCIVHNAGRDGRQPRVARHGRRVGGPRAGLPGLRPTGYKELLYKMSSRAK